MHFEEWENPAGSTLRKKTPQAQSREAASDVFLAE